MDRKEKYINYIVEDMLKKTRFIHDENKISLPFHNHGRYEGFYDEFINYGMYKTMSSFFGDYVEDIYGTTSEEVSILWDLYKERIESLIKK